RRRHTRFSRDWSSDVCSSDLARVLPADHRIEIIAAIIVTHPLPVRALDDERCIFVSHDADIERRLPSAIAQREAWPFGDEAAARSEERRVGKECGCRWGR